MNLAVLPLARQALAQGPIPQTIYDDVVEGRRVELRAIAL